MSVPSTPFQTLTNKVAIITGASRGIGAGIATCLASRGCKIALTYTSPSSATAIQTLISQLPEPSHAIAIRADLCSPSSPQEIINATLAAFGPTIHILVNNAGINKPTPLESLTPSDFSDMFDTNVRSVVLMTQAVLPHLPAQGGRIVNIGSTAARVGVPGISLYTSSKLAIEALTRSWASELGDRGVTVNCVVPGSVESELLRGSADAEAIEEEARKTPVGRRLGRPDDVGKVVSWLVGEESEWVSGQCICASGGYRMY